MGTGRGRSERVVRVVQILRIVTLPGLRKRRYTYGRQKIMTQTRRPASAAVVVTRRGINQA